MEVKTLTNKWSLYTDSKGNWKINIESEVYDVAVVERKDDQEYIKKHVLQIQIPIETSDKGLLDLILRSSLDEMHFRGEITGE